MATDILAPRPAATAAEQTAAALAGGCGALLDGLVDAYGRLWALVWANPYGLTPARVAAALGDRGASLFGRAAALAAFIAANAPDRPLPGPPAGYTVTPNADGSVTITGETQPNG